MSVLLSAFTTLGLGGPAGRFVACESEEALIAEISGADDANEPVLLLGGGSNLVVGDAGFPGLVLQIASRGMASRPAADSVLVDVAAGEPWDDFVAWSVLEGLSGVEALSGIPGLAGATPMQNVGAYGQEVSQTIASVRAFDREMRELTTFEGDECGFAYRTSRFHGSSRWLIVGATFRLARRPDAASEPVRYAELARALEIEVGERASVRAVRETVLRLRRGKGMVVDPDDTESRSAGSFFKNAILSPSDFAALTARSEARGSGVPASFLEADGRVKVAAAWLIERAGFSKGHGSSRVRLSRKHALSIVNAGGGTTEELVRLAREIQDGVEAAFGVRLVPEPVFVGVSP